ncbi:MAG TPA: OmpA family protein [Vicinamibacterales bacterium]|nr:OmpA family protein [Vicinamibacterales bacterium]
MAETALGRGQAPGPDAGHPAASDPSASSDEEFSQLRALLVGPEQRDLRALEAHVHDGGQQTREVSRVLPEALTLRSHDPLLAAALAPSIEKAITASVQRDPHPLADALFPVMGPAIRRAIEHMFGAMMESFSRTVEQSVSWRALQWRLTAWRTGRPFAEIVLLNTLQYRVEQVFLIHAETGLLLQQVSAQVSGSQDADQVSAMLTAIRDFVHDSFNVTSRDGLDAFRVGNLSVTIEQGPYAVLAGVVRGTPPPDLRDTFRRAIESVHLLLGPELKDFQGDATPFERARPTLEACLVTQLRQKPSANYRRWLAVAALVVLGLGFWAFTIVRARQRWQGYVDRLSAQPGIVVVSSGRRDGRFVISGLKDPHAADPAALLGAARIDPADVEMHWQPYDAIEPAFVVARATALLRPPAGAALEYRDGVLRARGAVSERWLIDSERIAPAIAGVRRFEYDGPSAQEQITRRLEAVRVLFAKGQSALMPEQLARATTAAALVMQLNDALRVSGRTAHIELLGHTDSDGSELENLPLSQARADAVLRVVGASAPDAISFTARGVGMDEPVTTGPTEAEKILNRRVSLRVRLTDQANAGSRP